MKCENECQLLCYVWTRRPDSAWNALQDTLPYVTYQAEEQKVRGNPVKRISRVVLQRL